MARASAPMLLLLLVASWAATPSLSLQFAPGSSCASQCLSDGETDAFDPAASFTNSSEIVCHDNDFSGTPKGKKYQSCLECLAKSEKVQDNEADVSWYMYNIRYAFSTCLFGEPDVNSDAKIETPCILEHACGPLKNPLIADNFDPKGNDTYGYCSASNGAFQDKYVWNCAKCLAATNDQKYLSNFITALKGGCEQKPAPGKLLSLSGTIFQTSRINITENTEQEVMDRPEGAGTNTLTTGAIAGIAIGAALLFLGAIALFFMHRRRKRQIERDEKSDWITASQAGSPAPILPPNTKQMTASIRTDSQQSYHGGGLSTAEYLEKLEEERRAGARSHNAPSRQSHRSQNSLPSYPHPHPYLPPSAQHLRSSSRTYTPSPPPAAARRNQTSTPESIAMRTYNTSTERPSTDLARASIPPPPPNPPPQERPTMPALSIPGAVPKIRAPRTYVPPTIAVPDDENPSRS